MKRVIIVGKGGSGKDYLRKKLEKRGFKYCVSYTSRPPRDGEKDGIDYHFIDMKQADIMIEKEEFYEYVVFNQWIYGTSIEGFYSSNLFIMTPSGLSKIKDVDRKESMVIYLDINEEVRKDRLSKRNDADKIERRLKADKNDFLHFTDFDLRITDPNFTLNTLTDLLKILPTHESADPFN
jgi:guanylate kinase